MVLFTVTNYDLLKKPGEGIRMAITLKRKIMSEMMTTYFPSLLLMMITYATTFFKPFFFEAALSVNLTTMLVMTTIFISKMEGLPPTSDIKMIDIWLILCQLVPFTLVVLLTAMEYLREEGGAGRKNQNQQKEESPRKECEERSSKLDWEKEGGIESWPMTTKAGLVTELVVVGDGEYSTSTSLLNFTSREKEEKEEKEEKGRHLTARLGKRR